MGCDCEIKDKMEKGGILEKISQDEKKILHELTSGHVNYVIINREDTIKGLLKKGLVYVTGKKGSPKEVHLVHKNNLHHRHGTRDKFEKGGFIIDKNYMPTTEREYKFFKGIQFKYDSSYELNMAIKEFIDYKNDPYSDDEKMFISFYQSGSVEYSDPINSIDFPEYYKFMWAHNQNLFDVNKRYSSLSINSNLHSQDFAPDGLKNYMNDDPYFNTVINIVKPDIYKWNREDKFDVVLSVIDGSKPKSDIYFNSINSILNAGGFIILTAIEKGELGFWDWFVPSIENHIIIRSFYIDEEKYNIHLIVFKKDK